MSSHLRFRLISVLIDMWITRTTEFSARYYKYRGDRIIPEDRLYLGMVDEFDSLCIFGSDTTKLMENFDLNLEQAVELKALVVAMEKIVYTDLPYPEVRQRPEWQVVLTHVDKTLESMAIDVRLLNLP